MSKRVIEAARCRYCGSTKVAAEIEHRHGGGTTIYHTCVRHMPKSDPTPIPPRIDPASFTACLRRIAGI